MTRLQKLVVALVLTLITVPTLYLNYQKSHDPMDTVLKCKDDVGKIFSFRVRDIVYVTNMAVEVVDIEGNIRQVSTGVTCKVLR